MRSKLKLAVVKSKQRFKKLSKNKQRITMVITTLVFVAAGQIIISSFAATTTYSTIPAVAEMQKLTEEVITLADDYAATPATITTKKGAKKANPIKAAKKTALIAKVDQRKEAILVAMKYDPKAVVVSHLPQTTLDKLPQEAAQSLEKPTVLEGEWESGRQLLQPANENTSLLRESALASVVTSDNKRISVYGSQLPAFKNGAKVRMYGSQLDGRFMAAVPFPIPVPGPRPPQEEIDNYFDSDEWQKLWEQLIAEIERLQEESSSVVFCVLADDTQCREDDTVNPALDSSKARSILVVNWRFPGEVANDFRQGRVYPTLDEQRIYMEDFKTTFSQMSYGKFNPQARVYERTVDMVYPEDGVLVDRLTYSCDDITNMALEAVQHTIQITPDLNALALNSTDILNVYDQLPCVDAESGQLIGNAGMGGWSNGDIRLDSLRKVSTNVILDDKSMDGIMSTYVHEFAHSIGLDHAGAACAESECGDSRGVFVDYGDPYNILGGQFVDRVGQEWQERDSTSLNVVQKRLVGWLQDEDIFKVEEAQDGTGLNVGTTTLNALWKGSGVRAVRVGDYFIEYRPRTTQGVDNFQSGRLSPGLLVYKAARYVNDEGRLITNVHPNNYSGSDQIPDTWLFNGKQATADDVANPENVGSWVYSKAGTGESFSVSTGTSSICVTPTNTTEESVEVRIIVAETCPADDITNYVYEKSISFTGGTDIRARDMDIDDKGNMYTMDLIAKRVSRLDKDGKLLGSFNVSYDGVNQWIAVNSKGEIYVTVSQKIAQYEYKELVIKYDKDGKELDKWDPGDLRHVSNTISGDRIADIEVNSDDNPYIIYKRRTNAGWSGYTQSIILKLDNELNEIKRWYLTEKYQGTSLAIDKDNNVYAFEEGTYNTTFLGDVYLPENCVHKFSPYGDDLSRWCKPNPRITKTNMDYYTTSNDVFVPFEHMELDSRGNFLMVPLSYSNNIAMYAGNKYIGRIGNDFGGFTAINLASDGKLYAVSNQAVHVFSPFATPTNYTPLSN